MLYLSHIKHIILIYDGALGLG